MKSDEHDEMQSESRPRPGLVRRCVRRMVKTLWTVALCALVLVTLFNVFMHFWLERDAERIAADTSWPNAFESVEYVGEGDVGVLMLHGAYGTPDDFRLLCDRLEARRISYYAPMLGGERPSPAVHAGLTRAALRDHAIKAYDHLAGRCKRIVVVGYSLGGVQAADVASRRSVRGLALVAPAFGIARRWYLLTSTEAWVQLAAPVIPYAPKLAGGGINDPSMTDYHEIDTVGLGAVQGLIEQSQDVLSRAGDIRSPVLCLLSAGDDVIDLDRAEGAVGAMGAADKRIVRYESSNHVILSDYDRQAATDELEAFIMMVTSKQ